MDRPVIQFRKMLNCILFVIRMECHRKMLLPLEFGSGSTCYHRRFQQWIESKIFKKIWIRLLKENENKRGIMNMTIT